MGIPGTLRTCHGIYSNNKLQTLESKSFLRWSSSPIFQLRWEGKGEPEQSRVSEGRKGALRDMEQNGRKMERLNGRQQRTWLDRYCRGHFFITSSLRVYIHPGQSRSRRGEGICKKVSYITSLAQRHYYSLLVEDRFMSHHLIRMSFLLVSSVICRQEVYTKARIFRFIAY